MTRAHPLPEPLGDQPFSVAQARAAGVSPSRLRASDLVAPTRGARVSAAPAKRIPADETASQRLTRLREDLHQRARHFAPALTPAQFFSHETGLALIGAPLPYTTADRRALHISARHPSGIPRRHGTVGHRLQARAPAPWRVGGLPIEHPARMWRQAGSLWELDDLIAAGDFLVLPRNGLLTLDDLRAEIDEAGDLALSKLARALAAIRIGSETAEETRLRLVLERAGLPEPRLNHELCTPDGGFVARIDLAYPRYRVGV